MGWRCSTAGICITSVLLQLATAATLTYTYGDGTYFTGSVDRCDLLLLLTNQSFHR